MSKDIDSEMVCAPFSDSQVKSINGFQKSEEWHPFTCSGKKEETGTSTPNQNSCREVLIATNDCLVCPNSLCNYTQKWVHSFMSDWSWHILDKLKAEMKHLRDD